MPIASIAAGSAVGPAGFGQAAAHDQIDLRAQVGVALALTLSSTIIIVKPRSGATSRGCPCSSTWVGRRRTGVTPVLNPFDDAADHAARHLAPSILDQETKP